LRMDLNPGDSDFEFCDDGNADNDDQCRNDCSFP
jgi:hypothetical protein